MLNSVKQRMPLVGPYRRYGQFGWVADAMHGGDTETEPFRSLLCLYEDERPLSGHQLHWMIDRVGAGRFSHWYQEVYFSATDGSDPNSNGRTYTYDFSLDIAKWHQLRIARSAQRWRYHPKADFFLARGGEAVPPPFVANLSLTNKCNLRCEICGSQKYLDESGISRRHMSIVKFEAVAETIFPFLSLVELNSQGDPLLHPDIETILRRVAEHRCDIKIQHNGTLLTDRVLDLLFRQHGTIMLSLDAVGPKFDEVRQGGVWSKAEPGLERLLAERDPAKLEIGVYPTVTRRTKDEVLKILDWAAAHNANIVAFHQYVPIANSFEEAPTPAEYEGVKDALRRWCAENHDAIGVLFESESMNVNTPRASRTEYASAEKAADMADFLGPLFPTEAFDPAGDPYLVCSAPRNYVEIGLDGQIAACCRSQDTPLGLATSPDKFADAWLGQNYARLRKSLVRGETAPYPLPNCQSCVKFFAPKSACQRRSVDYTNEVEWSTKGFLVSGLQEISLEGVRKDQGHSFIGLLPLGVDASLFVLHEDGRPLGPGGSLHQDIRREGNGRFHIGERVVYFSSSDGSSPSQNNREYSLRRLIELGDKC